MSKPEGVWVGCKLQGEFRLGGARDLVLGKPSPLVKVGGQGAWKSGEGGG